MWKAHLVRGTEKYGGAVGPSESVEDQASDMDFSFSPSVVKEKD